MGPERARPAEDRLADRMPAYDASMRREALVEARRAVQVAESLAGEYVAKQRTQSAAEAELRRRVPWLDALGDGGALATQLGSFGFYLAIK